MFPNLVLNFFATLFFFGLTWCVFLPFIFLKFLDPPKRQINWCPGAMKGTVPPRWRHPGHMDSIWIAYDSIWAKSTAKRDTVLTTRGPKKPQSANRLEAQQFSEENEQHINLGFKTHYAHVMKQPRRMAWERNMAYWYMLHAYNGLVYSYAQELHISSRLEAAAIRWWFPCNLVKRNATGFGTCHMSYMYIYIYNWIMLVTYVTYIIYTMP